MAELRYRMSTMWVASPIGRDSMTLTKQNLTKVEVEAGK